jgi:hypothetical protein
MNCVYCHYAAYKSPDPGMPAVSTCLGCHVAPAPILPNSPEIQKLANFAAKNAPIPWIRIHVLPEYVQFPHVRHVNAGVDCQTCHGPVQDMPVVKQQETLNMGWCVSCHIENKVRYDCATCHY